MIRSRIAFLTTLIALAGMLCVTVVNAQEKVVINFMSGFNIGTPMHEAYIDLIERYEAEHPHVDIVDIGQSAGGDELLLKLLMTDPPDIVKTDMATVVAFVKYGLLDPVPSDFAAVLEQTYYPIALQGVTIDGRMMAVPIQSNVTGLLYNTRHFAEAGISEPPSTWDEMNVIGPKLARFNGTELVRPGLATNPAGWSVGFFMTGTLHGEGGVIVDEQGRAQVDHPTTYAAVDYWVNAIARQGYMLIGALNNFYRGEVPMVLGEPYYIQGLRNNDTLHEIATAPALRGSVRIGSAYRNHAYAVNAASEKKDEAWRFLEWLATKKLDHLGGTGLGYVTSLSGALPMDRSDFEANYFVEIQDFLRGFVTSSDGAIPTTLWTSKGTGGDVVGAAMREIAEQGVSPQEAIMNAHRIVEAQLEAWKKQ